MLDDRAKTESFTSFWRDVEPRLRHALIPSMGVDAAADATAEALAYGWEHWDRLQHMENPEGYLYRVARTKARRFRGRPPRLPEVLVSHVPDVEPGLPRALERLSDKQRTVVWLVYGLEWQQTEVAELLGISAETVRTHLSRGMRKLNRTIGGRK
jgi:DNA-directed RNA polymerase specialized sigma24 family protein